MRLNLDTALLQTPDTGMTAAVSRTSSAGRSSIATGAGDSIGISGVSTTLAQMSGERAARMQVLAAAVAANTYDVSAAAIAGSILRQAGG